MVFLSSLPLYVHITIMILSFVKPSYLLSSSDGTPQVILRLSPEPGGLAIIIDLLYANPLGA
jgi:hypothetical protein